MGFFHAYNKIYKEYIYIYTYMCIYYTLGVFNEMILYVTVRFGNFTFFIYSPNTCPLMWFDDLLIKSY